MSNPWPFSHPSVLSLSQHRHWLNFNPCFCLFTADHGRPLAMIHGHPIPLQFWILFKMHSIKVSRKQKHVSPAGHQCRSGVCSIDKEFLWCVRQNQTPDCCCRGRADMRRGAWRRFCLQDQKTEMRWGAVRSKQGLKKGHEKIPLTSVAASLLLGITQHRAVWLVGGNVSCCPLI